MLTCTYTKIYLTKIIQPFKRWSGRMAKVVLEVSRVHRNLDFQHSKITPRQKLSSLLGCLHGIIPCMMISKSSLLLPGHSYDTSLNRSFALLVYYLKTTRRKHQYIEHILLVLSLSMSLNTTVFFAHFVSTSAVAAHHTAHGPVPIPMHYTYMHATTYGYFFVVVGWLLYLHQSPIRYIYTADLTIWHKP